MKTFTAQPENTNIRGIHTARFYDMSSPEGRALEAEIEALIELKDNGIEVLNYHEKYQALIARMAPFQTRESTVENIVPTVGRSVFAQRLAGTLTYSGTINYGALGTSSTAVANSDTQLGTEVFRKIPSDASYTTNVAAINFYFSKADTNGTYTEWGAFIDGTGSANTGQIFSHVLTGGWVKASSETMTISCSYTFS